MSKNFPHHLPKLAKVLSQTGSLTALLEQQAGKPLQVQVLSEGLRPLTHQQKSLLGLPPKMHLAWVRTVRLYGSDDDAWVLANSVFPLSALVGRLKRLKFLGKTPIGYVLFRQYRTLPYERSFYQSDTGNYGRRTVYAVDGHKILIDEQFLPSFVARLAD
ncbi:chorismate--pyruvate lyase family protein [Moraxella marmotae]|uniref:chorismate--pyruvate lyase family protein n=1 Tax=Moraxella marmotae TaxID=3344520 RepID=UPI0035F4E7C4